MRLFPLVGLLGATVALVAGCDSNSVTERGSTPGSWTGAVAPGKQVEIINISGSTTATLAGGDEVIVRWTKEGDVEDLSSVEVVVSTSESGITVRADYPAHSTNVGVDFVLEIPAGVAFRNETVSGRVQATGLESDVFVTVVSGTAVVSTTQLAEAHVVSGNANVRIGRAEWSRDIHMSVQSGTLDVTVPSNVNAEVFATAISGTVTCDFPLSGTSSSRHGTLGSGGHALRLTVVSGNVHLHAGPDA